MKKAWEDVKSFITVIMVIGFVGLTFLNVISGDKYYDVFLIIVSFYFGTQHEKITKLMNQDVKDNIKKKE